MSEDSPPLFGLPELDSRLSSVLPPGWMGLLLGRTGAGAPLAAKQFAHAGVGALPVLYYTTYERTDDVVRAFRDFGWSPDGVQIVNVSEEYYSRVLVRDLEVARARERGIRYADLAAATPRPIGSKTFNLTSRLLSDLAGMQGRFRLVLDSVDFLLELLEPSEVLTVARQVRHCAQTFGGQALVIVQAEVHERRTTGLLEDMSDLVLEFGTERSNGSVKHGLTVRKVRNHPERTHRYPVAVTEHGLELSGDTGA